MIGAWLKNCIWVLALMALTTLATIQVGHTQDNTFSPEQREAIESVIHEYLINNPQVLLEAVNALQGQQEEAMMENIQQNVSEQVQALLNSNSPVAGNPTGNVTLVEFFDYQCVYCKRMQPIIENLMTTDPNLRIVFKEFPVFRGDSIFAAKAALAAEKQGKYLQFHQALMKDEQRLTRQRVLEIAQTIGLDIEQLQQDIDSSELDDAVQSNMELASDLGLIGTPAFIITSYPASENLKVFFVPGETSEANLQSLIEQARSE